MLLFSLPACTRWGKFYPQNFKDMAIFTALVKFTPLNIIFCIIIKVAGLGKVSTIMVHTVYPIIHKQYRIPKSCTTDDFCGSNGLLLLKGTNYY